MNEIVPVVLSFFFGIALGFVFFEGLLWTIKKGVTARSPAVWFSISFLIRIGLLSFGMYFVSTYGFWAIVACFIGLMLMRYVVQRRGTHDSES